LQQAILYCTKQRRSALPVTIVVAAAATTTIAALYCTTVKHCAEYLHNNACTAAYM